MFDVTDRGSFESACQWVHHRAQAARKWVLVGNKCDIGPDLQGEPSSPAAGGQGSTGRREGQWTGPRPQHPCPWTDDYCYLCHTCVPFDCQNPSGFSSARRSYHGGAHRVVRHEEALQFAHENDIDYFEVSAKDDIGIRECLFVLSGQMLAEQGGLPRVATSDWSNI